MLDQHAQKKGNKMEDKRGRDGLKSLLVHLSLEMFVSTVYIFFIHMYVPYGTYLCTIFQK